MACQKTVFFMENREYILLKTAAATYNYTNLEVNKLLLLEYIK